MKRVAGILAVITLSGAAIVWLLLPERESGTAPFLGYVDADTMLVAPKQTGRLVELVPREGTIVQAGERLFALDAAAEVAAVAEAKARLDKARAQLADLRAAQQRPEQIEVLQARRRKVAAALELSRAEFERQERLHRQGVVAEARLDQARTAFDRDRNALAEAEREIDAARLPARESAIEAAAAEADASAAALARARIAYDERTVAAPKGGRVLDVLYRVGEVVPAGQPVIELLPPENVLIRFYVPEAEIAGIASGMRVSITCDGCPNGLTGEVGFIASEVEFTPPVIFSRQERAKLVFMVEAHREPPEASLRPGLPVEVRRQ